MGHESTSFFSAKAAFRNISSLSQGCGGTRVPGLTSDPAHWPLSDKPVSRPRYHRRPCCPALVNASRPSEGNQATTLDHTAHSGVTCADSCARRCLTPLAVSVPDLVGKRVVQVGRWRRLPESRGVRRLPPASGGPVDSPD